MRCVKLVFASMLVSGLLATATGAAPAHRWNSPSDGEKVRPAGFHNSYGPSGGCTSGCQNAPYAVAAAGDYSGGPCCGAGGPCVCPHVIGGVLCHVKHTLHWLFCAGPCHSTCLADGCGGMADCAYGGCGASGGRDCCTNGEYGGSDYESYDTVPPATVVPTPTEANPFKDDAGSGAPQALKRRTIRPTGAVLQAVPRASNEAKRSIRPRPRSDRSTMLRKTSATMRSAGSVKSIRSQADRNGHSVQRRGAEVASVRRAAVE